MGWPVLLSAAALLAAAAAAWEPSAEGTGAPGGQEAAWPGAARLGSGPARLSSAAEPWRCR